MMISAPRCYANRPPSRAVACTHGRHSSADPLTRRKPLHHLDAALGFSNAAEGWNLPASIYGMSLYWVLICVTKHHLIMFMFGNHTQIIYLDIFGRYRVDEMKNIFPTYSENNKP